MTVKLVTVVEVPPFPAQADLLWDADERLALIGHIARSPTAGDLIPGSGGLRKLRWAGSGRGKRGGSRVVYYFLDDRFPVYLLTAFAKGRQEDLSRMELAALAKASALLKAALLKSAGGRK